MSSPVWTTSSARPSTKLQKKESSRFIVRQSPKTIRNKSLWISSQSYPALMTQSTFSFYNPFQKTLEHLSGKPWLHLNFSSPKTLLFSFTCLKPTCLKPTLVHHMDITLTSRWGSAGWHLLSNNENDLVLAIRHVPHLHCLGSEWSENNCKSDWFYVVVLKMSHDH